jgi:hypothetical protein
MQRSRSKHARPRRAYLRGAAAPQRALETRFPIPHTQPSRWPSLSSPPCALASPGCALPPARRRATSSPAPATRADPANGGRSERSDPRRAMPPAPAQRSVKVEARRTVKPATKSSKSAPSSAWYGPDRPKVSERAAARCRAPIRPGAPAAATRCGRLGAAAAGTAPRPAPSVAQRNRRCLARRPGVVASRRWRGSGSAGRGGSAGRRARTPRQPAPHVRSRPPIGRRRRALPHPPAPRPIARSTWARCPARPPPT